MAHGRAPANNPAISQPSTCLTSSSLVPGQPPTNGSRPAWQGDEREGHQKRFLACWRGGNAQQGAQTFPKSHLCPVSAHCSQPFSCFCKQHAGKPSAPRCILPAPGAQLSTKEPENTPALCLHLDEPALPPGQSPAGRQNRAAAALGRDAHTSPAAGSSGGPPRPPAPHRGGPRATSRVRGSLCQPLSTRRMLQRPAATGGGGRQEGSCPTGEEKFTVTGWCPVGKAGLESCLSAPFPSPFPTASAPHGEGSGHPPQLPTTTPARPPRTLPCSWEAAGSSRTKSPSSGSHRGGHLRRKQRPRGYPRPLRGTPPRHPPSRPRSSPWAHGARCPPPVRGSARLRSARLGPGAERGGAGAAEGSARPQPPVPGPGGRWWVVGGTAMEHPPWGAARRAGSPQRDPAHPAPSWRPPALPQRLPGCIGEWGARGSPPASPGALPSSGCGEQQPPAGHPAAQRLASPRGAAAASRFASCPRPSFLLPAAPAWRRAG